MQDTKTTSINRTATPDNHSTLDVTIDKKKQKQPCLQDRIKLIYIDDEYSDLTQGIWSFISFLNLSLKECIDVMSKNFMYISLQRTLYTENGLDYITLLSQIFMLSIFCYYEYKITW